MSRVKSRLHYYAVLNRARLDGIEKFTSLKHILMDECDLTSQEAWNVVSEWLHECLLNPEDLWYKDAVAEYIKWLKERSENI